MLDAEPFRPNGGKDYIDGALCLLRPPGMKEEISFSVTFPDRTCLSSSRLHSRRVINQVLSIDTHINQSLGTEKPSTTTVHRVGGFTIPLQEDYIEGALYLLRPPGKKKEISFYMTFPDCTGLSSSRLDNHSVINQELAINTRGK